MSTSDAKRTQPKQTKTRAELIREGKIKVKKGGRSGIERMQHFEISLLMSEKETRNGKVVKDVELNRSPYIRIAEAEGFVKNWPDGYLMKIVHNPKKYLTGEKHINLYDMCERVEEAVNAYNLKNS